MIEHVEPDEIPFQRVAALLERVVEPDSDYTIDGIFQRLMWRQERLLKIGDWDAICIYAVYPRDRRKVLYVAWLAGTGFRKWVRPLEKELRRIAEINDVGKLEFCSERKIARLLERYFPTYRYPYTIYSTNLE